MPSKSEIFFVKLLCPNVYHYILSMNLIKAFEGHQLANIGQIVIKLTKKIYILPPLTFLLGQSPSNTFCSFFQEFSEQLFGLLWGKHLSLWDCPSGLYSPRQYSNPDTLRYGGATASAPMPPICGQSPSKTSCSFFQEFSEQLFGFFLGMHLWLCNAPTGVCSFRQFSNPGTLKYGGAATPSMWPPK